MDNYKFTLNLIQSLTKLHSNLESEFANLTVASKTLQKWRKVVFKIIAMNKLKRRFTHHVRGKGTKDIPKNLKGNGKEGHFIEKLFGIAKNCSGNPDYDGFELKFLKPQSGKITFGDWRADEYLFQQKDILKRFNNCDDITKNDFFNYFGKSPNGGSWSGSSCIPKYNEWHSNGTIMICDDYNNLYFVYSHKKDQRTLDLPNFLTKQLFIVIAYWSIEKLKRHVEDKFNQKGIVMIGKNNKKIYDRMLFGYPININRFMECIKLQKIVLDSGMNNRSLRLRQNFRADKNFWLQNVYYSV